MLGELASFYRFRATGGWVGRGGGEDELRRDETETLTFFSPVFARVR